MKYFVYYTMSTLQLDDLRKRLFSLPTAFCPLSRMGKLPVFMCVIASISSSFLTCENVIIGLTVQIV